LLPQLRACKSLPIGLLDITTHSVLADQWHRKCIAGIWKNPSPKWDFIREAAMNICTEIYGLDSCAGAMHLAWLTMGCREFVLVSSDLTMVQPSTRIHGSAWWKVYLRIVCMDTGCDRCLGSCVLSQWNHGFLRVQDHAATAQYSTARLIPHRFMACCLWVAIRCAGIGAYISNKDRDQMAQTRYKTQCPSDQGMGLVTSAI
jgi:hypothetical protein